MECPNCHAPYQPGDRFCGNCGERLVAGAPPPGAPVNPWAAGRSPQAPAAEADPGAPTIAVPPGAHELLPSRAAAMPPGQAGATPEAGLMTCPTCSAPVEPGDTSCLVCGSDLTASAPVEPSAAGRPSGTPEPRAAAVCPIHGAMDPTWTRCPQCIREGRDGRLVPAPTPPVTGAGRAGAEPASTPPARPSGGPVIRETVPPPDVAPAARPAAEMGPVSGPPPEPGRPPAPPAERPVSSVGGTVVIRRRPRMLAYLIEKEGEQVGRVFQVEHDVTDIGRDPRNHVVISDVHVSGFHARLERLPNGEFTVQDRGSSNGSRLNGEPLTSPRPMRENDELSIGKTTLVLKIVT